ncbi:MAG TPA: hypothetical protein VGA08_03615 [Candidatus Saccharimonadales bacterium]
MTDGANRIKLELKAAPLIVAHYLIGAGIPSEIYWPNKFERLGLDGKNSRLTPEHVEQLGWIKRQYEALKKNSETAAFAPHVLPLMARVDLAFSADKSQLAAVIGPLMALKLAYFKHLADSLTAVCGYTTVKQKVKLNKSTGPLVTDRSRLRVISFVPTNELELGFNKFYGLSDLSWANAYEAWADQSYDFKEETTRQAIKSRFNISYQLEGILEPQLLNESLSSRIVDVLTGQSPTTAHGYNLPDALNDGGMMERCFDYSYKLFGSLQKKTAHLAPLACLWGHRQRYLLSVGYTETINLHKTTSGRPAKLAAAVVRRLAEKHPILHEELGQRG